MGLHSHMLAVRPEARGLGLGRRLKWFQRRWCLERGIDWVTWTFDPLQARNARLNIEHLGVVVHEYQADFYGPLGGSLAGDLPTDRFVALWNLRDARVAACAASDPAAAPERLVGDSLTAALATASLRPPGEWALTAGDDDHPGAPRLGLQGPWLWVAAPRDINNLRAQRPLVALAWTEAMRSVSEDLVHRGYQVRAFAGGAYGWALREKITD
jgi:predicted GNAT superfamily acetyltransferase